MLSWKDDKDLCAYCKNLDPRVKFADGELEQVDFGTTEDIYTRRDVCFFCDVIYTAVEDHGRVIRLLRSAPVISLIRAQDTIDSDVLLDIRVSDSNPDFQHGPKSATSSVGFVRLEASSGEPLHSNCGSTSIAKSWNPSPFSDILHESDILHKATFKDFLRQFLHCLDSHPTCKPLSRENSLDIFLIDTKDMCIVKGTTNSSYVALSYVWGEADGPQWLNLSLDNLATLYKPEALSREWNQIPKVIQQTIKLVQHEKLPTSLLWVDAMCIIHDDPEHKHDQITRMDAIYGQALFTILAESATSANQQLLRYEDGDFDGDFRINSSTLQVRKGVQILVPVRDVDFLYRQILFDQRPECEASRHQLRGWTFQERLLSRRTLACNNLGMFYSCATHDTSSGPTLTTKVYSKALYADTSRLAPVRQYYHLVAHYTHRSLSYQSDILNAFAGIISALSTRGQWGQEPLHFACGIPLDFVAHCLHWTLITKDPDSCVRPSQPSRLNFPTWTWANCDWSQSILYRGSVGFMHRLGFPMMHGSWYCKEITTMYGLSLLDEFQKTPLPVAPTLLWVNRGSWPQLKINTPYVLHVRTKWMRWPIELKLSSPSIIRRSWTPWVLSTPPDRPTTPFLYTDDCTYWGWLDHCVEDWGQLDYSTLKVVGLFGDEKGLAFLVVKPSQITLGAYERVGVGMFTHEHASGMISHENGDDKHDNKLNCPCDIKSVLGAHKFAQEASECTICLV